MKSYKLRRFISNLLIAVISFGSAASAFAADNTAANADGNINKEINIGDYLQMGVYYGKPILWRCAASDENGQLFLSDKILCLKAFDASGDNTEGSHGRGFVFNSEAGYNRRINGSNYWGDSNIRDWLNSDADAGKVVWSCGNPPSTGNGAYADEAGFLNAFTEAEKAAIKTVTQKQILYGYEYSRERDPNYKRSGSKIDKILQNYDTAYSEETTDKVFLLDEKQIYEVYTLLGDYCKAYPSAEVIENNAFSDPDLSTDMYWHYWLRSPDADSYSDYFVPTISASGGVVDAAANNEIIGVRPAFYLDSENAVINSGTGTEYAPYILKGSAEAQNAELLFGDADDDGRLSAADAAAVLQKVLNNAFVMQAENKTKNWLDYIDVDTDGTLTAADSAAVLQKVLNSSFIMPVENKLQSAV